MKKELTKEQIALREKCRAATRAHLTKIRSAPGWEEGMSEFRKEYALTVAMHEAKVRSGLTQKEIAKRMGIAQPNVSRIEHCRAVTIDTLTEYLKACGFTFTLNLQPLS